MAISTEQPSSAERITTVRCFRSPLKQKRVTFLWQFNGTNGKNPSAGLADRAPIGNFYGTTEDGGTNNDGTVFKITSNGH